MELRVPSLPAPLRSAPPPRTAPCRAPGGARRSRGRRRGVGAPLPPCALRVRLRHAADFGVFIVCVLFLRKKRGFSFFFFHFFFSKPL